MSYKDAYIIADNVISEDLKILVFRSNIDTPNKAVLAGSELMQMNEIYRVDINFEVDENILHVECHPDCSVEKVKKQIAKWDFMCSEFPSY